MKLFKDLHRKVSDLGTELYNLNNEILHLKRRIDAQRYTVGFADYVSPRTVRDPPNDSIEGIRKELISLRGDFKMLLNYLDLEINEQPARIVLVPPKTNKP